MESNTKTVFSIVENKDGSFDCVWDDPSEAMASLACVIAGADKELLQVIQFALAVRFASGEDLLESFIAQLCRKTEKMKRAIEKHEKLSKEEE